MGRRRADLVAFVNGLPLVLVELKAVHRRLEDAYADNLRDYKAIIPQCFPYNAFIILSNGAESRIGTLTAAWEHFAEWKRVGSEDEAAAVSLETIIRGTCDRTRLLDLVENFTLFREGQGALLNAAFIAFTRTPLLANEEPTRRVFGDYVSVYNFAQSVQDGATVPL
jgi:type I restriction enzyme, R subunit